MAYLSLYRKYRSQSFDELVGQPHVTAILQNAVRLGRVAHAYLFCGPRGCGKTSTARLLAKCLNCLASDGPTPTPCGVCDLCVRVRDGVAIDVIEMDAASETGIDDVREKIIENAKYSPAESRFKVYIIDEVHDLSAKAFDSLLKTIEEPPTHVIFVLATTEAHKVPITIRSRCQRMDFRRGTLRDLVANLQRVCAAEKIECEPGALGAIAVAAEGSFRDSLSLLEQVTAYTEGPITLQTVSASIGTVGPDLLDRITASIADDDMVAVFTLAGQLADEGKDVRQVLSALQAHFRDLLVARLNLGADALHEVDPERLDVLAAQASRFTQVQLLAMLERLAEAERDLRYTHHQRLLLERTFWRLLPANLHGTVAAPTPPRAATEPSQGRAEQASPPARRAASETASPPSAPPRAVEPDVEPAHAVPTRSVAEIDIGEVRRVWSRVRTKLVRTYPAASVAFPDEVIVSAINGQTIELAFPVDKEFNRTRADKPKVREAVAAAFSEALRVEGIRVACVQTFARAEPGPATQPASPGLNFDAVPDKPSEAPGAVDQAAVPTEDEELFRQVSDILDARPADEET